MGGEDPPLAQVSLEYKKIYCHRGIPTSIDLDTGTQDNIQICHWHRGQPTSIVAGTEDYVQIRLWNRGIPTSMVTGTEYTDLPLAQRSGYKHSHWHRRLADGCISSRQKSVDTL